MRRGVLHRRVRPRVHAFAKRTTLIISLMAKTFAWHSSVHVFKKEGEEMNTRHLANARRNKVRRVRERCTAFSRLTLTSGYSRRPRDVREVSRCRKSTQRSLSNYLANGRPVRPPHLHGEKEGQVGGSTSFSPLSQQNQAPVFFSGLLPPSFFSEPRSFQHSSSHSSGGNDSVD